MTNQTECKLTIFRKVVIKVNNYDVRTIELSHISDNPNCFHKRTFWTYGLNKTRFNEVESIYENHHLDEELKGIESSVRHYGKRVLMNI